MSLPTCESINLAWVIKINNNNNNNNNNNIKIEQNYALNYYGSGFKSTSLNSFFNGLLYLQNFQNIFCTHPQNRF